MRYDSSMYGDASLLMPSFNPINASNAYAPQDAEVPIAANQASQGMGTMVGVPTPSTATPIMARGIIGKPASWWVMLVIVLAIFIFVSRKFGGPEKFGNIRLTLWNATFAVLFYVIVLNFIKVIFSYWKVPGLSELVAAA